MEDGTTEALPTNMTADEFIAWAMGRQGKYELFDGEVVAMAPERAVHTRIKTAAHFAFRSLCRSSGLDCEAFGDGTTVRIDETTAYEPDVSIRCGPRLPDHAIEMSDPVIVVEVLSPSTAYHDVGAKLQNYFRLASVQHYLILQTERPLVIHHARAEGDLIETRILGEGTIALDPPGIEVAVEALYDTD